MAPDVTAVVHMVVHSAYLRGSAPYTVDTYRDLRLTSGLLDARLFLTCRHPGPDVHLIQLPGNYTCRTALGAWMEGGRNWADRDVIDLTWKLHSVEKHALLFLQRKGALRTGGGQ